MEKKFLLVFLLFFITNVPCEVGTTTSTMEQHESTVTMETTTKIDDLNVTTTTKETSKIATLEEVMEAMENLTKLIPNDDILDTMDDIIKASSIVAYLANENLNYDNIADTSKMHQKFNDTREIFLSTLLKNHLIVNSIQKSLETLFTRHGYSIMPYVINSYVNRIKYGIKYSHDSFNILHIPKDFYEAANGDRNVKLTGMVEAGCGKINMTNIYHSLFHKDIPTDLYDILKNEYFNDQIYDLINIFVISLLKQTIIIDSICEKIINEMAFWGSKNYKIQSYNHVIYGILKNLKDKNVKRKKEFWNSNITSALVKNHIFSKNITENSQIAKSLSEALKQNYTKTGYVFGVGVYKNVAGNFDHAFYGNYVHTVFNITEYKNKNVFIMRTTIAKIYKQCPILNSVKDYETEICQVTIRGRNLPSLIKWIHRKCPELDAIIITRYNLDFYGVIPNHGMISKNYNLRSCYFGFTLTVSFKPE